LKKITFKLAKTTYHQQNKKEGLINRARLDAVSSSPTKKEKLLAIYWPTANFPINLLDRCGLTAA
jgi:hypothetical protein